MYTFCLEVIFRILDFQFHFNIFNSKVQFFSVKIKRHNLNKKKQDNITRVYKLYISLYNITKVINILFTKTNLQAPIAEVLNLTEIKILLCIHAKNKFTYYQEKILQGDQSKDLVESTCERFQLLKMSALLCAVAFD